MRALRTLLVVLALCAGLAAPASAKDWTSASTPGDGSVFTFRGSQLGESIDKKFKGAPQTYSADRSYCEALKNGVMACHDYSSDRIVGAARVPHIGDVPVRDIKYLYLDRKLYAVTIPFVSGSFPTLAAMLVGKYGEPHVKRNAPQPAVWAWHVPGGELAIMGDGDIGLYDTAAMREIDARQRRDAAQQGKSAF